jgi:hypothetical protein
LDNNFDISRVSKSVPGTDQNFAVKRVVVRFFAFDAGAGSI